MRHLPIVLSAGSQASGYWPCPARPTLPCRRSLSIVPPSRLGRGEGRLLLSPPGVLSVLRLPALLPALRLLSAV